MALFQKDKLKLPRKTNLPVPRAERADLTEAALGFKVNAQNKIPNASLVYGVSSAALLSLSLYHLLGGAWLNAFLLFVLSGILFAFALYFLRFQGH